MTAEQIDLMTLEAFIRQYDHDGPFELVDGVTKTLMPNIVIHQVILKLLFRLLDHFCTTHQLGEVFFEAPFVELYSKQWVKGSRTPDLLFISAEKWTEYVTQVQGWQDKPLVLIPDLVVEIVSPNDSYIDLEEKVDEYLDKGVRMIWLIDPQRKRARVYEGSQETRLNQDEALSGGDVLPGLEIKLLTLFENVV